MKAASNFENFDEELDKKIIRTRDAIGEAICLLTKKREILELDRSLDENLIKRIDRVLITTESKSNLMGNILDRED